MLTKMLERMEKEVEMLKGNFEGFEKKGVFSCFSGIVQCMDIKLKLNLILTDICGLKNHFSLNEMSESLAGRDGIFELEKNLQDKKKQYERLSKKLKIPMTKKQREELMAKMEVCKSEAQQLYAEFMEKCSVKFPKIADISQQIQGYWDMSNKIIEQLQKQKNNKKITSAKV